MYSLSSKLFVVAAVTLSAAPAATADSLRSRAVVDLSFDEESGSARDAAARGNVDDAGRFGNAPPRVPSPFWNQAGKQALKFDAGRKQYVSVADGQDVDRAEAVTASLFFLNLLPLSDGGSRGVFAKRAKDEPSVTNYGVNFAAKSDDFRVYVNDGTGFKVASYSVKQTVNTRRLVHLTATWEVADAPGADSDTDADDVRVRLFVNGSPVKPTKVSQGFAAGDDAWLTDLKTESILNDVPLVIGATNAAQEHVSGLVDEFLLFDRALSPDEARTLFTEVAGEDAAELAALETQPPQTRPRPQITALSQPAFTLAQTTRLTVSGKNLQGGRLFVTGLDVRQKVQPGSNAGRLVVDVTPAEDARPGYYPLRVATAEGTSPAVPVVVDGFPLRAVGETSPENPAQLPVAVHGTLRGAQAPRVDFRGKAGQRIVADVELRRLGGKASPVLELKTERGTPLSIAWSKVHLQDDTRIETTLPADGLYYVELHDLAYKAPGRNPFRIRVGDLALVDGYVPLAARRGDVTEVRPVGVGLPADARLPLELAADGTFQRVADAWPASSPVPALPCPALSDGLEIVEQNGEEPQVVDVAAAGRQRVYVNGRLGRPGEEDVYVLEVAPRSKLELLLLGRAVDSPIDGRLRILSDPDGRQLALSQDRAGSRDPLLNYDVPANVKRVRVAVSDLHGNGGPDYLYRLRITPPGVADFELVAGESQVRLPQSGAAVLKLDLTRRGFGGPIGLRIEGDDEVAIWPERIPAGRGNGPLLARLTRTQTGEVDPAQRTRTIRIVAESLGTERIIRRDVRLPQTVVDGFASRLPMTITAPEPLRIEVTDHPDALFKGALVPLKVRVQRPPGSEGRFVRFSLLTTETPRLVDPNNAKKGNKPLVRLVTDQALGPGRDEGTVRVAVPLDVAEKSMGLVVRAEVVPHPYSRHVSARAYSKPFRLPVEPAVGVTVDSASLKLQPGRKSVVRGTLQRTAGFGADVAVSLAGLPKGYVSRPAEPAESGNTFRIEVTPPGKAKPGEMPKVTLRVTDAVDGRLLARQPVALKVVNPK